MTFRRVSYSTKSIVYVQIFCPFTSKRLDAGWPARAEAARKSAHEREALSELQDCGVRCRGETLTQRRKARAISADRPPTASAEEVRFHGVARSLVLHSRPEEVRLRGSLSLGLELVTLAIRRADDIAPVFRAHQGQVDALYIPPDPLLLAEVSSINALASGDGLKPQTAGVGGTWPRRRCLPSVRL
jgi:hypothetical protein